MDEKSSPSSTQREAPNASDGIVNRRSGERERMTTTFLCCVIHMTLCVFTTGRVWAFYFGGTLICFYQWRLQRIMHFAAMLSLHPEGGDGGEVTSEVDYHHLRISVGTKKRKRCWRGTRMEVEKFFSAL